MTEPSSPPSPHPAPTPELVPGEPVRVRFGKWGGGPHWAFDLVYLGVDEFGHWAGGPEGLPMERPGRAVLADTDGVLCFAHTQGFVATRNADFGEPTAAEIYVDVTTVPRWTRAGDGVAEVRMVDLDLDVVRRFDGVTYVDDEDEFADHQLTLGYPVAVIDAARRECGVVLDAVRGEVGVFGPAGARWLAAYRSGPHHPRHHRQPHQQGDDRLDGSGD